MKPNKNIHRYFRLNDIVINEEIWGKRLFVIQGFGGNEYLPELYVYQFGKPQIIKNLCNWDIEMTILINSFHRPFKKIEKNKLVKLSKISSDKVKEEIKREIIIRTNQKLYGFI